MTIDTKAIRNAAAGATRFVSSCALELWPITTESHIHELAEMVISCADHIDTLAAENARLRTAIIAARREIHAEREGLMVCHGIDGVVPADDKIGTEAIAGLDLLLIQIDTTLSGESKS